MEIISQLQTLRGDIWSFVRNEDRSLEIDFNGQVGYADLTLVEGEYYMQQLEKLFGKI